MTAVVRLPRNEVGRDIICGDVHGCFNKLAAALSAIAFRPGFDRLIFCGDLIDRGPESDEALGWLRRPWVHSVLGNHEQMAMMYYSDETIAPFYGTNGGGWFMRMPAVRQAEFVSEFRRLPLAIEMETEKGLVVVVHADMPAPTWAACLEMLHSPIAAHRDRAAEVMTWGRGRVGREEDWGPVTDVRAVVHGHTPVACHTSMHNVHYVDGGAWMKAGSLRPFILLDASTLAPIKYDNPARLEFEPS